ncbi:Protein PMR5 [Camellia lanceoleosa]|uniref:Protein PMR5 n=1 Tax=Camellia lanceoleosa TaxID=1840588 RepID=A0ACC0GRC0_9ERIC|nr:Protein PMR5 [Camellia lanceoleosa]
MRGKIVMFVGDSLGRNQWELLICMTSAAVPQSRMQMMKGDPLSTFKFLDYGVAVSFCRSPYLVDIDVGEGKRVLKLDDISKNGNTWRGIDVLSFNTDH